MTTLTTRIEELRGTRNYVDFAKDTGVNRQTLKDAEQGVPIRLNTLRQIARASKLSRNAWQELLILWIRSAVGDKDFERLHVRPASEAIVTKDGTDIRSLLLRLFGSAPVTHQSLVIEALSSPKIMDCLASVARLFNLGKGRHERVKDEASAWMRRTMKMVRGHLPWGKTTSRKRTGRRTRGRTIHKK